MMIPPSIMDAAASCGAAEDRCQRDKRMLQVVQDVCVQLRQAQEAKKAAAQLQQQVALLQARAEAAEAAAAAEALLHRQLELKMAALQQPQQLEQQQLEVQQPAQQPEQHQQSQPCSSPDPADAFSLMTRTPGQSETGALRSPAATAAAAAAQAGHGDGVSVECSSGTTTATQHPAEAVSSSLQSVPQLKHIAAGVLRAFVAAAAAAAQHNGDCHGAAGLRGSSCSGSEAAGSIQSRQEHSSSSGDSGGGGLLREIEPSIPATSEAAATANSSMLQGAAASELDWGAWLDGATAPQCTAHADAACMTNPPCRRHLGLLQQLLLSESATSSDSHGSTPKSIRSLQGFGAAAGERSGSSGSSWNALPVTTSSSSQAASPAGGPAVAPRKPPSFTSYNNPLATDSSRAQEAEEEQELQQDKHTRSTGRGPSSCGGGCSSGRLAGEGPVLWQQTMEAFDQDVAAAAVVRQLSAMSSHVEQQLEELHAWGRAGSSISDDLLMQVLPLLKGARLVLEQSRRQAAAAAPGP